MRVAPDPETILAQSDGRKRSRSIETEDTEFVTAQRVSIDHGS